MVTKHACYTVMRRAIVLRTISIKMQHKHAYTRCKCAAFNQFEPAFVAFLAVTMLSNAFAVVTEAALSVL